MPKSTETKLPSTLKHSDSHAQHTWKKAHDNAVETYGDAGRANRVAYAALKHSYKKAGDKWVEKSHKGPSDPQAARGPATHPKSTDKPAPTAGGKTAKSAPEARKKAKEARQEYSRSYRERKKKKT